MQPQAHLRLKLAQTAPRAQIRVWLCPQVKQEVETERTPAASRDVKNVVALCMLITDNAVSCTGASGLCGFGQGGSVVLDSAAR